MPFIFNGLWPLISPLAFTSLLLIWQCRRIRILQWHGRPAHIGLLFCKYFTTIHVVLHLFAISIFKRCFLTGHCLILSAISFYTGKVVTRTFLYDERGVRYVSFLSLPKVRKIIPPSWSVESPDDVSIWLKNKSIFSISHHSTSNEIELKFLILWSCPGRLTL